MSQLNDPPGSPRNWSLVSYRIMLAMPQPRDEWQACGNGLWGSVIMWEWKCFPKWIYVPSILFCFTHLYFCYMWKYVFIICVYTCLFLLQFLGEELVNGLRCDKWRLVDTKGTKVNKYTMWIRYKASVWISSLKLSIGLLCSDSLFIEFVCISADNYCLNCVFQLKIIV
jgi:hypothetical protein